MLAACNRETPALPPIATAQATSLAANPDALHVIPLYGFPKAREKPLASIAGAGFIGDPAVALYSVTGIGGDPKCDCGIVYELTPRPDKTTFKLTSLEVFHGSNGAYGSGSLAEDASGNLYGAADNGGNNNHGVVFKLTKSSSGFTYAVIHAFKGGSDGEEPNAPLLVASDGSLYGTTFAGGVKCSCGLVYKLTPASSRYTKSTLYTFASYNDAYWPNGGLIADQNGDLIGTTEFGGAHNGGTVFELLSNGRSYTERVIHSFGAYSRDGVEPTSGLLAKSDGTLFGTTLIGGDSICILDYTGQENEYGCGTLFKVTPEGSGYTESIIHEFTDKDLSNGAAPWGPLSWGEHGLLYGTAEAGGEFKNKYNVCNAGGGSHFGSYEPLGCGVVFSLEASGMNYKVLCQFSGDKRLGASPFAPLLYADKAFYGTTSRDGPHGEGVAFKLTQASLDELLHPPHVLQCG